MKNLSFGLKDLTYHEAMNLASSAFPPYHHITFVKVSQLCHMIISESDKQNGEW